MPNTLHEILRNSVKDKLARGEVVSSMMVRLVRGVEIARIAKTAGFDTFYIDMEHSSFSLESASQICMAALAEGIPALVRVPANTPEFISRVLDGGAMGIIAPHVRNAEQAREVVRLACFSPLGERSANSSLPQLQYRSFEAQEAHAALNQASLVTVMMESQDALEQVEAIAAVEGVDMLLVGTNDLTSDWGVPGNYDDPRVTAAYQRTIAACRKHGKHVGIGGLAARPDLVEQFVHMGARFVSTGSDLAFLLSAATAKAKAVTALPRPA